MKTRYEIWFRIALTAALLAVPMLAAAADSPEGNPHDQIVDPNVIQWLYDSPLTVYETIVDLGGGQYEYRYNFENVDDANIWHFTILTTFECGWPVPTWTEYPSWYAGTWAIGDPAPAYDPIELDPDIFWYTTTWAPGYEFSDDPIVPGASVSGFGFTADVNDDGPKYYYYETLESGYAIDTGYVAAVGLTVPAGVATEPATWTSLKASYR